KSRLPGGRPPALPRLEPEATEALVILSLVVCPALLIPFANNPFEPHKAAFLWTAGFAACVAAATSLSIRPEPLRAAHGPTSWLLACIALATIVMFVSTARSESPALAWWGSPVR